MVAIAFACKARYLDNLSGVLHILGALFVTTRSLVMLCVAIEAPAPVITLLEGSCRGSSLFTYRGRCESDLQIATLLVVFMGVWGIVMATVTLVLIFGIYFVGLKQPEAFNEIFRQTGNEADSYNLETGNEQ